MLDYVGTSLTIYNNFHNTATVQSTIKFVASLCTIFVGAEIHVPKPSQTVYKEKYNTVHVLILYYSNPLLFPTSFLMILTAVGSNPLDLIKCVRVILFTSYERLPTNTVAADMRK